MAKKRGNPRLRRLLAEGEISRSEFNRLSCATKKRRVSRKQKAASLKNLRRACKSIDKKRTRGMSKLDRQVNDLQNEIKSIVLHESQKAKLKRLKEERRALRSALRDRNRNVDGLLL